MDFGQDVFSEHIDDSPSSAPARIESIARGLGRAVAVDSTTFRELLPELVSGQGQHWAFGHGLAEPTENPKSKWSQLVTHFADTPEDQRQIQILRGFLSGLVLHNPELVHELLDEAVERSPLSEIYPSLQTSINLDQRSVARLARSTQLGLASAGTYRVLSGGMATDRIPGPDFRDLILAIAAKPGGLDVATQIVHMRLFSEAQRNQPHVREVLDAGRQLLRKARFIRDTRRADSDLAHVAKLCLVGEEGVSATKDICSNLRAAILNRETYAFYHDDIIVALVSVQPIATLNALLGGETSEFALGCDILGATCFVESKPLDVVPDEQLVSWCDVAPEVRYPAVAGLITFSHQNGEDPAAVWTSKAWVVLQRAPNRVSILKKFLERFRPLGGFVDSAASILKSNASLLNELEDFNDPDLKEYLPRAKALVNEALENEKRLELLLARQTDERFEW